MRTGTTARSIAVSGVALLAVAACGGGGGGGGGTAAGGEDGEKQVNVYGTDGNMGNALGEKFTDTGALAGMKGTTPLTKLSDDFKNRLLKVDPKLKDFNYAGESYDAVVIISLAAETARTTKATDFAKFINGVTTIGTKCTSYKDCKALVDQGKDIDYDGVTGPLEFAEAGEPSVASFAILQFGKDNKLNDSLTKYVEAGDQSKATKDQPTAPPPSTPAKGAPLKIGSLLPQTGDLAFLGPPEFAGVELAKQEVNAGGGALGKPIQTIKGDSGDTSTNIASQTVDKELQQGVSAIIGAAASGVSLKVIDKIVGAGVVQFSPANTSDELTTYDDKDLYFRTAPPDVVQAQALSDQIVADGNQKVYILARNDPYGKGLMQNTQKDLVAAGIKDSNVKTALYETKATEFTAEVNNIKSFRPDAVVVIGFDESATILKTMNEQGVGPKR